MKVAIISEYSIYTSIGGTEVYIETLIKGLLSKDAEVNLITLGKGPVFHSVNKAIGNKKYTVSFIPKLGYEKEEIKQEKVSNSWNYIYAELSRFEPDVIHCHTLSTFFNIRHLEKCRQKFSNIILSLHVPGHFCIKGDLIKYGKFPCNGLISNDCFGCMFTKSFKVGLSNLLNSYHKKLLDTIHFLNKNEVKIICTAEWQLKQLITNGFNNKHGFVIRQMINPDSYEPVVAYCKPKKNTIGYIGRFVDEKGASLLLRLLRKILINRQYDFKIAIPSENSDSLYVNELKVLQKIYPSNIEVLFDVAGDEKRDFFSRIDVLVIPSYCIETGPIVLLESLLYNKKVVAPDVGGPLEFHQAYPEDVLLYSWNNLNDFNDKIITAMKSHFEKESTIEYVQEFNKKQSTFISSHLSIYELGI